jgi:DNA-binding response OmpR family regulator
MSSRPFQPALSVDADAARRDATIIVAESNASIGRELVEQLRADRYRAVIARTAEHARVLARAQPIRAIVLGALDAPRDALDLLDEIRGSLGQSTGGQVIAGQTVAGRAIAGQPGAAQATGGPTWDRCLPAIVLGQTGGQLELLRAFEMGADDFIHKGDSLRVEVEQADTGRADSGWASLERVAPPYLELRARLRAVLRRAETSAPALLLNIGLLEIDENAHMVRVAGVPMELCRLEYELLVHLARNPTAVCSKQELLRAIWHQHASVRTVDSHASRLRRKLGAAGATGLVVNVWGVGYRLM